MNYTFQWGPVWEAAPTLLSGALITLQLTVLCSIFGLIVGVFLALARRSTIVSARLVASAWIGIARNTPSLLQIFLAYFGLGAYGIHISPWWAVFVAVTWNTAGYMAEIIRGGFAAVNPRQRAAALSLGMSSFQSYRYVVLPQVLKAVFLPLMNQVVLTLLGTSLARSSTVAHERCCPFSTPHETKEKNSFFSFSFFFFFTFSLQASSPPPPASQLLPFDVR